MKAFPAFKHIQERKKLRQSPHGESPETLRDAMMLWKSNCVPQRTDRIFLHNILVENLNWRHCLALFIQLLISQRSLEWVWFLYSLSAAALPKTVTKRSKTNWCFMVNWITSGRFSLHWFQSLTYILSHPGLLTPKATLSRRPRSPGRSCTRSATCFKGVTHHSGTRFSHCVHWHTLSLNELVTSLSIVSVPKAGHGSKLVEK